MKTLVKEVVIADPLQDVVVRMIMALNPKSEYATQKVKKYVNFGPGPRGAQSVIFMSKVKALLDERINVSLEDIQASLLSCLRHRLILGFHAEADAVSADDIINEIRKAK